MAKAIQRRRGTSADHATFTGLAGEMTVDTDKKVVVVHDGSTPGGFPGVNFGFVTPGAAAESSNEITLDVKGGSKLFFKETLGDDAEVHIPTDMPDGATIYFLVDPDSNTLTWASGYVGSDDALPESPTDETLFVIIRDDSRYIVLTAGQAFGDGS